MISDSHFLEELKFTIIVPTRERADTLVHCLRSLLAQKYGNYEIIVSDNDSQDATETTVKSFIDKRIRYINTGQRLSMSHNWEFALSYVTDGWVMFLGDDDGLYPWALRTLSRYIQVFQVEAVSSARGQFQWPGHFEGASKGSFCFPMSSGAKLKKSKSELLEVFAGKSEYVKLPWLYHGGAASIELIRRISDESGRFFCSRIPDLYSAVALSLGTDTYLSIDVPIAINGASKHSTGTSLMQSGVTSNSDKPFARFNAENNIPFHESMIQGKSLLNILYECYLQSAHIHKGKLNLSLERQLHVAMKIAPREHLNNILVECSAIAQRNGISFSFSRADRAWRRMYIFRRRFGQLLGEHFSSIKVIPREVHIDNIFDATMFASSIYSYFVANPLLKYLCFSIALGSEIIRRTRVNFVRMNKWLHKSLPNTSL